MTPMNSEPNYWRTVSRVIRRMYAVYKTSCATSTPAATSAVPASDGEGQNRDTAGGGRSMNFNNFIYKEVHHNDLDIQR